MSSLRSLYCLAHHDTQLATLHIPNIRRREGQKVREQTTVPALLRSDCTRRDCLRLIAGTLFCGILPRPVAAQAEETQLLPKVPEINAFFQQQVTLIQQQLGSGFEARLAWYTPTAMLPAAAIGDPAMDYKSSGRFFGDGHCGTFQPGEQCPYDICPPPGAVAADATAASCCRHFAYLTPYSPSAISERSKVSTVVVSPRLAALQDDTWKAMLVHELGHCIDVHVFGAQYKLLDHQVENVEVATALNALDAAFSDPEVRADVFGNALLAPSVGRPLCYDPKTLLQTLVSKVSDCIGSGEAGDVRPMAHYLHDPLQGFVPKS